MQIGSARDCRRMQPFPAGWLVADWQKNISSDEMWQQTAAYLLMVHGGAAMATLLLLGALIPVHVQRSRRSGKNLISGSVMVTRNMLLVVTALRIVLFGGRIRAALDELDAYRRRLLGAGIDCLAYPAGKAATEVADD